MSRIFEALQKIQSQQTPAASGAETITPEPVAFWTEQHEEELRPTSSFAPSGPPPRPSLTSFAPGLNALRQRCAKPAWKLHKDSLVLFNEQSFDQCAEQCRAGNATDSSTNGIEQRDGQCADLERKRLANRQVSSTRRWRSKEEDDHPGNGLCLRGKHTDREQVPR